MSEFAVLGKNLPRVDGFPKATGEAAYAADLWAPGCLHGRILRSPYPHARILNIDTAKAEAVPGVKGVFTAQNAPNGPYGLWIRDETLFSVEFQMDAIARALGMDPLELRRKNAMGPGDPMVNGQCYPGVCLRETLEQAASAFGCDRPKKTSSNGRKRGIGLAYGSHPTGGMGSSAVLKLMSDGTVQILSGIMEIGAGEYTVAAQIAAETLGVPYEKVRVIAADTDKTPFESYTAASRSTFNMGNMGNMGNSVRLAAQDARQALLNRAAEMLEDDPADLKAEGEGVFIAPAPDRGLSYAEVVKAANMFQGGPIIGKGSFAATVPPLQPRHTEQGIPPEDFPTHGYVTHIAEVEVDEETGQVEILRMVCSHDIGQVINLGGLEGQIEGGVTQGVGYALVEEMVFEGGALVNGTMVDYKIPNILDAPPLEYHFIEMADPAGPYGAKGMGESVLVPTAPAIANAVCDALGARVPDLPITPEKVLQVLREKG